MRGMTMRVAIMTVSDGVAAGEREDRGGPACEEALRASGIAHEIVSRQILADDRQQIARAIRLTAYSRHADLIVLTGGTGVAPRDRTPEAVREVVEFEVPGLAEKMRSDTGADFPAAYLSRQVVGDRKSTRLNSSHVKISYAVFCLKKKKRTWKGHWMMEEKRKGNSN